MRFDGVISVLFAEIIHFSPLNYLSTSSKIGFEKGRVSLPAPFHGSVFSQLGFKTIVSGYIAPVWYCLDISSQPLVCLLVFFYGTFYRSEVLRSAVLHFSLSLSGILWRDSQQSLLERLIFTSTCLCAFARLIGHIRGSISGTRHSVLLIYVSAPSRVPGFLCYCSAYV